ncbi:NUDIX domain-containing protein [Candidatus Woesearchaeota archaeon]|nr:NUDIX domain-containing protein [Candidatus Woesearchaeota archaeon]
MKALDKKERQDIFKLFLENSKLRFNEIEKSLDLRSNMVSYHLEQMQKLGLITKKRDFYHLTKDAEKFLPLIPNLTGESLSPLPVILVAVMNKDKILLLKRKRRPYKDYWGLIGGKMLHNESFSDASIRQAKEKANITCRFISINSVLHERVQGEQIIKHSFILFFAKTEADSIPFKHVERGELRWFSLDEIANHNIIPSDMWLIQNKLDSKISVNSAMMDEHDGTLSSFRILE